MRRLASEEDLSELHLSPALEQPSEGTFIATGTLHDREVAVSLNVTDIAFTDVHEEFTELQAGEAVTFRAEQGRGAGTVDDISRADSGVDTVELTSNGSDDRFQLHVEDGPLPLVSAALLEYQPASNDYEYYGLGQVTTLSRELNE